MQDIRACTVCAPVLPHAPWPVVVASADSRILIIGQAPGARVHASSSHDSPRGRNNLKHIIKRLAE
ncbi:hypothetical protein AYM40_34940 [Paraburkholderia phytofirmans OLGA172]|uniref:Uracil-DNA glycosylase-like domain-containing protein n=1 Tax=Paraburkholderia phytofirmans OLGA172 TaxID=1417228 RepID=A0A160FVT6_9BURK|nr:hypothetical protein AYM40_34940 [Paraburkholderia phytofirmans OLGA172]